MESSKPYLIEKDQTSVLVWSPCRLKLDPRGWMLEMRNELRAALKGLQASEGRGSGFYASFASPNSQETFDVENVLLFNVGTGVFSSICKNSVCLERFVHSPNPNRLSCLSSYHISPGENKFQHATIKNDLARWENVPIPSIKGSRKPHEFWYPMKNSIIDIIGRRGTHERFGLNIRIQSPKQYDVNLAAAIKPLIDGVISSLHNEDGIPNAHVLSYLSASLNEKLENIRQMLCDERIAVLGPIALVHSFIAGIQWNPADDNCVALKVTIDRCLTEQKWLMSGSVFTVDMMENGINDNDTSFSCL